MQTRAYVDVGAGVGVVLGTAVLGIAVLGTAVLQHQYEITLNTALVHAATSRRASQSVEFYRTSRYLRDLKYLGVAVLGVAVLGTAVLGVAVLGTGVQVVTVPNAGQAVWKVAPQAACTAFLLQSEIAVALVHVSAQPAVVTLSTFQAAMFWLKAEAE